MKKTTVLLIVTTILLAACNNSEQSTLSNTDSTEAVSSTVDPSKDWKFGIALWTFHTVNFPQSLDKVDSAGIKYIEPNTFHSAGPEFKDSMILQLSPASIEKLKTDD